MRSVIQRVSTAQVEVDGKITGKIGSGLLVLVGIVEEDGNSRILNGYPEKSSILGFLMMNKGS